ncbi:MAG TPA: hypothetical protein VKQ70_05080 [Caulobacteraceae bacterium]|jgi:hypothetical protein|nr:hypothetical protein [Caulobacteraceae bacterium]
MTIRTIVGAAALACLTAEAAHAAPWRAAPDAGAQTFRYEVRELSSGPTRGYRMDYRLRADRKGGLVAEIVRTATFDGKDFTPVTVDDACAKAMSARPGELATVRLAPLTVEQAKLGDAFLPSCAPGAVFFPLTDILNVALIQLSDRFHVGDLKRVGQTVRFPGFSTSLDRAGVAMAETSPGGEIGLTSLDQGAATLDWKPEPADLDLTENYGGQAIKLHGTEHFAFRLVIDARTGWLEHGETLYDNLDMAVALPNVPPDKAPRVTIKRVVSIVRLDG